MKQELGYTMNPDGGENNIILQFENTGWRDDMAELNGSGRIKYMAVDGVEHMDAADALAAYDSKIGLPTEMAGITIDLFACMGTDGIKKMLGPIESVIYRSFEYDYIAYVTEQENGYSSAKIICRSYSGRKGTFMLQDRQALINIVNLLGVFGKVYFSESLACILGIMDAKDGKINEGNFYPIDTFAFYCANAGL